LLAGRSERRVCNAQAQIERLSQRLDFAGSLLEEDLETLDFSSDQKILADRKEAAWVMTDIDLLQLWRNQIRMRYYA